MTQAADPHLPHQGDLSRRVAHRRMELGLSIEEVAHGAGIDPGYLGYFEQSSGVRLSAGTMFLLALALQTTPNALEGGRVDRPPGRGRAGRHPQLEALTPAQCEAHLSAGGVGRLAFMSKRGPEAHPVNFRFTGSDVIVSTTVIKAAAVEAQPVVGFEIDQVDDAMSEGWSVLVTGRVRRIDDPDELLRLASLDLEPWAGGDRHAIIAIHPDEITGRVIIQEILP